MTRTPALTITVYDKAFGRRGPVRGLLGATASFRWNQAGSATFDVLSSDRRIPDLRTQGCRAVIEYWSDRDAASPTLTLSGLVSEEQGSPRTGQRTAITFTLEDDWVEVLQGTIGWVRPDKAISAQGSDEDVYWKRTGPAETVALAAISANATRTGGVTVPTSLGRGTSITVQLRFHPLVDRLFPAVDDAGIGLQVVQQGATRAVVVRSRTTYPEVLTDATGEVVGGSYRLTAPDVTRVVAGGSGKKDTRVFRQWINTADESAWGLAKETFVDCRDLDSTSATFEADMLARMKEAAAEGSAKAGCNAKLQESRRLRIGDRITLGTQVQIQLGDGPVVTDLVREIQVSTDAAGLTVTPMVGLWDESGDQKLWALIAAGNKRSRDLGTE